MIETKCRIPLSQGKFTVIDAVDYEAVSLYKWHAHEPHPGSGTWYAVRNRIVLGKRTTQSLHAFLTGFSQTDHKDGDSLNNCRDNLRVADDGENARNQKMHRDNSSGFKGVVLQQGHPSRPWQARIMVEGQRKSLGYFTQPEEAAMAYDAAAKRLHGEFARLNFEGKQ